MAGARALWVANGMKREQFGKPIIAIVNSFTQFASGNRGSCQSCQTHFAIRKGCSRNILPASGASAEE